MLGAEPGAYIFKQMSITGTMVGSMHDTARALQFADRVCLFLLILSTSFLFSLYHG